MEIALVARAPLLSTDTNLAALSISLRARPSVPTGIADVVWCWVCVHMHMCKRGGVWCGSTRPKVRIRDQEQEHFIVQTV
jgi:hypothetical protein